MAFPEVGALSPAVANPTPSTTAATPAPAATPPAVRPVPVTDATERPVPRLTDAAPAGLALQPASTPRAGVQVSPAGIREQVFMLRTTRDSREKPSEFCAAAGFPAFAEDRFRAWSVQTDASSGEVTNPRDRQIGELRACVGNTPDRDVVNFYMKGTVAGAPELEFRGTCRFNGRDTPEPGAAPLSCTLTPSGEGIAGGQVVTNTMNANSPAYSTPSFMIMRLWRRVVGE